MLGASFSSRGAIMGAALALSAILGCGAAPDVVPPDARVRSADATAIRSRLRDAYFSWRGADHRLGGTGKSGIDCSGFVQSVFREKFGVALPRTTAAMAKVGSAVGRNTLSAGDLVFFKPRTYPRHVGIYLGGEEFLHVSARKGVMISRTDDRYWSRHYWTARRILR